MLISIKSAAINIKIENYHKILIINLLQTYKVSKNLIGLLLTDSERNDSLSVFL